jgi:hypothetical protein
VADQQLQFVITAVDRSRAAFASIEGGFAKLQAGAASLQSTFAGIAALGALTGAAAAFRSTVNSLDAFNDASDKTGASVEELSSLLNTLSPYGATLEQISDITGKLARAMAGAEEGTSKAADAFKALGVSTRDAAGNLRPTLDVLDDVAQGLSTYADGTNKTALAQALFGKSGAELLPVLKDLAGAQKVGATASTEQAQAAEAFNIALGRLKVQADAAAVSIAGPLLKNLTNLIDQFKVGKEAAGGFFAALGRYGTSTGTPEENIERVKKRIDELNASITKDSPLADGAGSSFGRGARSAATGRIESARKELEQLTKDLQYFALLQTQAGRNTNLRSPGLYDAEGSRPAAPRLAGEDEKRAKAAATQASEAERLLKSLTLQLEKTQELSTEQEVLAQIRRGEIAGLTPALEKEILLRATQIDKVKEEAKAREELKRTIDALFESEQKEQQSLAAARQPLSASLATQAAQILRELPSAVQAAKAELTRYFDERLIDGLVNEADWKAAIDKINGLQDNAKEKSVEAKDAARELGLTFQSAFEDAIVGGNKLSDVLKGLAQDLTRLVIRKSITEPLAAAASGYIGDLFGGDSGAKPASASSAPGVTKGLPGGGELFVPDAKSRIVPSVPEGAGMNLTLNVASGVTRQELLAAGEGFIAEAQGRILKSMRGGGAFA